MRRAADNRELAVLEALVQLYIERREPISSRMLEEHADLGIRSASIRSVLGELEHRKLLTQPHPSAGRVPTDAGYRAYVDSGLHPDPLGEAERREIERALDLAGRDLEAVIRAMAQLLGRFSSNIAIVAGPKAPSLRIHGIELYEREGGKVLVVVSLENRAVRSELVDLGRAFTPEAIGAAAAFLVERLAGRRLDETRLDLEHLLAQPASDAQHLAADVALSARSLFDADRVLQLTFEGIPDALGQPEFSDPERLKALLQVLAKAEELERAFSEFVRGGSGEVSVAIGRENRVVALQPFALLGTRFELLGLTGYLGILGPCRMRYSRMLALMRAVASHLDRLG